jgi:hypothetical protein
MLTDLKTLCAELRDVDRRLGETHDTLPDDGELARQIRNGIATVRSDQLADAVTNLEALLSLDEPAAAERRRTSAELLARIEEPWPSENVEIRSRLRGILTRLLQVDDDLTELLEHLVLPRNVEAMWNSQAPTSFTANAYAASAAVREDCVRRAITALLHAGRQDAETLVSAFERERAETLPGSSRVTQHAPAEGATFRLRPDGSVLCEEVQS